MKFLENHARTHDASSSFFLLQLFLLQLSFLFHPGMFKQKTQAKPFDSSTKTQRNNFSPLTKPNYRFHFMRIKRKRQRKKQEEHEVSSWRNQGIDPPNAKVFLIKSSEDFQPIKQTSQSWHKSQKI